jgi:DNA polymerase V
MLFDLQDKAGQQGNLLDIAAPDTQRGKDNKLMSTLDALNQRYGRSAVRFGAEGGANAPWHMKHTRRSPRYTSAWEDLPTVEGGH